MMSRLAPILLLVFFGALIGCSEQAGVAGKPAGSETSDELAARVLDTAGAPLAAAQVRVRPLWYALDSMGRPNRVDPSRSIDTWTDPDGRFAVKVPPGTYRVEVRGNGQGIVIPVRFETSPPALATRRARPLGSVSGHVPLPKGVRRAWIRVFGQQAGTPTDDSGKFFLPAVAYGDSGMLLSATASGVADELGEAKVHVRPHATVFVPNMEPPKAGDENHATWTTTTVRTGLLSERAKRAAVAGQPRTALVRLNRWNFDFTTAAGDGRDLRFALPDGTPLPYFPRFYDSASSLAHIDVRLPAGAVGDTAQRIVVHSGRSNVSSRADSLATWSGIADSLVLEATSFLIDDFAPPTNRAKLPMDIPIGPWYIGNAGFAMVTRPVGGSEHMVDAIQPAGSDRTGNAFALEYASVDTSTSSYVVLGTNLAPTPRTFRAMDSIVFWARGNGRFWFAMEDALTVSRKAWIEFASPTQWTRYRIRPVDFLPEGTGGNKGWIGARDSIQRISFIARGGNELWIADLRLHGLGAAEMR